LDDDGLYPHHLHNSLTSSSRQPFAVFKVDAVPLLQILPEVFFMEKTGFKRDTLTTACSKTSEYAVGQSNLHRMFLTKYCLDIAYCWNVVQNAVSRYLKVVRLSTGGRRWMHLGGGIPSVSKDLLTYLLHGAESFLRS
jgi:hypothetical protein